MLFLTAVLISAQVAEPSSPPLVPIEQALPAPATAEPRDAGAVTVSPRPKRVAGTLIGAIVGDAVTGALWFAEMSFFSGACGVSCFSPPILPIALSVLTIGGLAPFGALAGNRIAGGNAPYWKTLLGTLAGGLVTGIFLGLFAMGGFFSRDGLSGAVAASVSILPLPLAQVLATELGADE